MVFRVGIRRGGDRRGGDRRGVDRRGGACPDPDHSTTIATTQDLPFMEVSLDDHLDLPPSALRLCLGYFSRKPPYVILPPRGI